MVKFHDFDKYGRPLIDIYLLKQGIPEKVSEIYSECNHVNKLILDAGHSKPYMVD
jgi:hypothetical protein